MKLEKHSCQYREAPAVDCLRLNTLSGTNTDFLTSKT